MSRRGKFLVGKELKCLECGAKDTIQRPQHRNKKAGHIKTLWCIICKKRTHHKELPLY